MRILAHPLILMFSYYCCKNSIDTICKTRERKSKRAKFKDIATKFINK